MATQLEQLPNGKWRVYRDFDCLPAAQAAVGRLATISEAAFSPPKPIIASVPRVPHNVAAAMQRDLERDDDEGEPIKAGGTD